MALDAAAGFLGAPSAGIVVVSDGIVVGFEGSHAVRIATAAANTVLSAPTEEPLQGLELLDPMARYLCYRPPALAIETVIYWVDPSLSLTPAVRERAAAVAALASGLVRSGQLVVQAEGRARAAEAIVTMLTTVVEPGPVDQMLAKLAAQVAAAIGAQIVAIDSYDSSGTRIQRNLYVEEGNAALEALGDRWRKLVDLRLRDARVESGLRTIWKTPVVIPDLQKYEWQYVTPHPDELAFYADSGLHTVAACPLWIKDEFVGIMFCCDTFHRTYSREELRSLRHMSEVVAAAIKGTELMNDVVVRARSDSLTGLLNHGAILAELERILHERPKGPHAVVMADVRGLKLANDLYGHLVGDDVLRWAALALAQDSAVVGRYGGDEFLVVLPDARAATARRYVENVRSHMARNPAPLPRSPAPPVVELTMGWALYPRDGVTVKDLIGAADREMYRLRGQMAA